MMEAARTSETLVNFYQNTRRNTPEDSHLQNLISYVHYKGTYLYVAFLHYTLLL
jgi:hypothetical protein